MNMFAHSTRYSEHLKVSLLLLTFLSGCATDHPVKAFVVSETYADSSDPRLLLPNAKENADRVSDALAGLSTAATATPGRLTQLTRATWESEAKRFSSTLTDKDYAVVYVSAHGAVDSGGDIVLFDATGSSFRVTGELQDIMKKASASVFFLDICRKTDDAIAPSNFSGVKLVGPNKKRGSQEEGGSGLILFSTDLGRDAGNSPAFSDQVAQEVPKRQELRVTLRNIIGNVSYLTSRTSDGDKDQHPWVYGLIPSDIYLAGPPRKPGTGP
jgi:Caspase domain